jgi:hypothetical protein
VNRTTSAILERIKRVDDLKGEILSGFKRKRLTKTQEELLIKILNDNLNSNIQLDDFIRNVKTEASKVIKLWYQKQYNNLALYANILRD